MRGYAFLTEIHGTAAEVAGRFTGRDILFVTGPAIGGRADAYSFGVYRRQEASRLRCACCGAWTFGRQWPNQDTGYGLCRECVDFCATRTEDMARTYGARGIHYDIDLQGRED
ncbi:hypothetical protein DBR42_18880 [Pelomonas sp. HMWF004]|nr:hypothetical protein DBR42_18880 [Pelomonas sp. HMWF004]